MVDFHDRRPGKEGLPWIYGPAKTLERHSGGGYTSEHKEGWRIKAVPSDQVDTPGCTAGEDEGLHCGGAQNHEHPHVLMMDYRVGSISKRRGG